jgi:hypothetical protein
MPSTALKELKHSLPISSSLSSPFPLTFPPSLTVSSSRAISPHFPSKRVSKEKERKRREEERKRGRKKKGRKMKEKMDERERKRERGYLLMLGCEERGRSPLDIILSVRLADISSVCDRCAMRSFFPNMEKSHVVTHFHDFFRYLPISCAPSKSVSHSLRSS